MSEKKLNATQLSQMKAAEKAGLSLEDYKARRAAGDAFCKKCKEWAPESEFPRHARGTVGPNCYACLGKPDQAPQYRWVQDPVLRKALMRALKKFNTGIMRKRLEGLRRYFRPDHLRAVLTRQKGRCAECHEALVGTAALDFQIPLENGGKLTAGNVIIYCGHCAKARRYAPLPPRMRVCDYNSFGTAIAALVQAVVEKDRARTSFFSHEVDIQLRHYIQCQKYVVYGSPSEELEPYKTSVSKEVVKLAKDVTELLETVHKAGEYNPKPNIRGSGKMGALRGAGWQPFRPLTQHKLD